MPLGCPPRRTPWNKRRSWRRSPAGGREAVGRWLAETRDVRQRRLVWGEPALDALKRLLTDHAAIWVELGLDGPALDDFVLAPSRADALRTSLWAHAVTVLINEISRDATRELQAATRNVEVAQ